GQGKGPFISIHESFRGLAAWKDLLPGHDRIALDVHPDLIFVNVDRTPLASQINKPIAGEFSLAVNDCGQWINGIGAGTRWEGTFGSQSDGDTKDNFKAFALRNLDALGHWFFWTWKIGASSVTGKVETPMWSYQLGLQEGGSPTTRLKRPASAATPPQLNLSAPRWSVLLEQDRSRTPSRLSTRPPTTINPGLRPSNVRASTATGAIPTLPVPTPVVGNVDGWYDAADNRPMYTRSLDAVTYPDAWGSADAANPGPCGGATTDNTDNTENTDNTDDETTRRVRRVRNVIPKPRRTPAP
ncbi:hypothetical protein FRB90_009326, partial [Tulasnella sp. 427]